MKPIVDLQAARMIYSSGAPWARRHLEAVKGAHLEVRAGETLGLVGESGSGKTTVGRLCLGLARPTSGRILFDGRPYPRRRQLRGQLSVVLQHPQWSLNPRLRIGTSVAEPLVINRWQTRQARRRRVAEMLADVGLEASLAERYPHELSGGQRQRVAIARALISEPRFVVFDEAVSALDVSVQAQILNLLKRLQDEHGFGALFISHDLAAVRYVAHRIAVMRAGEVVEVGPTERFYTRPEHPYSRALLEASDISVSVAPHDVHTTS